MAVGAELTDIVEEEGAILAVRLKHFFSLHVDHYCTVQVLNQASRGMHTVVVVVVIEEPLINSAL